MISGKFIRNSLVYTIAGALPMASAIVLLPFYVQDLSTALFGKLSIFLAFSLFVQIVVTYSFDSSVYVHYHEYKRKPEQLADFVSSAFIVMLIIAAGVGIVLSLSGELLFRFILSGKNISFFPYGLASVATGVFQALIKVHSSFMQTRERPDIFFWSNSMLFILIAGLTILGLKLYPDSMVGPIGGRLVASSLVGAWVLVRVFREFGVRFRFTWLKSSFSFNNYVFIYQIEQWVINYFDRILLVFFLPVSTVGIYDFGLKCLVIIELVMNGIHNSFYPKVVGVVVDNKAESSTPELNRYYHGLVACVMILVCVCIVGFPLLIDWFVQKSRYHDSISYIPFLAVLYLPRVVKIYFGAPYGAKKHTRPLPLIYFIVSAVKILLIVTLVGQLELFGVIVASTVAACTEVVLLKRFLKGVFAFRFNFYKMTVAPALLFLFVIGGEALNLGNEHLRHVVYLVFCVLLLWALYRRELSVILSGIIAKFNG